MTDIDLAIVNSLRRIILADLPNVAFLVDLHGGPCDVVIHKNQSSLHNEYLLHRLSMIPLCFDKDQIDAYESQNYKFVLAAKNEGTEMMDVTTEHFQIYDSNGSKLDTLAKQVFPKNKFTGHHILITRLKPNLYDKKKGDEIDVTAHATVDTAKRNACWSPVSICSYYNNIDVALADSKFIEYFSKMKGISRDEAKTRFDTLERYRYFKTNKFGEPNSFTFMIETECHLNPTYLFEKAILVLIDKVQDFASQVVESVPTISPNEVVSLSIEGHNHTVGNLVQALTYNMFVRDSETLDYIGYYVPHPLEERVTLKVKSKSGHTTVKPIVQEACAAIIVRLQDLVEQWRRV